MSRLSAKSLDFSRLAASPVNRPTAAILCGHQDRVSPSDCLDLVQRNRQLRVTLSIGPSRDQIQSPYYSPSTEFERTPRIPLPIHPQGCGDYSIADLEISLSMQDLHLAIHQPVMI